MAEIKTMLLGILLLTAVTVGFATVLNEWYANANPSVSVSTNYLGLSNASDYVETWASNASYKIQNPVLANIPVAGQLEQTLTVVVELVSLLLNIPAQVVGPIIGGLSTSLLLPDWFKAFLTAAFLITMLIAVVNALKGKEL